MPRVIAGLLCSWGNIYKNMALQVGGVSKIETIKFALESCGTQIRERLRFRCTAKN
jgi:hypothetical protein